MREAFRFIVHSMPDIDTSLDIIAPSVYDYDVILRPKKTKQTHTKVDSDSAVVGTCNVTYDSVADGANILSQSAEAPAGRVDLSWLVKLN